MRSSIRSSDRRITVADPSTESEEMRNEQILAAREFTREMVAGGRKVDGAVSR